MAGEASSSMLKSMTGFGSAEAEFPGGKAIWEIRAVNGKGLDVRLRTPPGLEAHEPDLRKRIAQVVSRGSLQASLSLQSEIAIDVPMINESTLASLAEQAKRAASELGLAEPRLGELLAMRGVLEARDSNRPDVGAEAMKAIHSALEQALGALNHARIAEGGATANMLIEQISEMEALRQQALNDASRSPEKIRQRLAEQVASLLNTNQDLDQQRLHQEAALLAVKADIREELDRLHAHLDSARELISGGSPVGRKLEFLAQEFNRETNTLCSKSNDLAITEIGLSLKAVVDQFREQCLNVE